MKDLFPQNNSLQTKESYATVSHIRELYNLVNKLESTVSSLQTQIDTTNIQVSSNVSPLANFVDNSDFTFSHKDYSTTTDETASAILAKWYARSHSTPYQATAYNINTNSSESAASIRAGYLLEYVNVDEADFSVGPSSVIRVRPNNPNAHEFGANDPVKITVQTGALPSPLTANTTYYVKYVNSSFIDLATTSGGAAITWTDPNDINALDVSATFTVDIDERPGVRWDKGTGTIATSGGYTVASRLSTKYAFLGNTIYFKMQIVHKPRVFEINTSTKVDASTNKITVTGHNLADETLVYFTEDGTLPGGLTAGTVYRTSVGSPEPDTFGLEKFENNAWSSVDFTSTGSGTIKMKTKIKTGLRCRASLWDNLNNRIFRGEKPELSLTKVGTHSGTLVTRYYILEVQMPDGRRFYSNTTAPHSIADTVPTDTVDSDSSVAVRWEKVSGASRYNVYRKTNSGPYYLIGTIPASSNTIIDYGGGNIEFTVPSTFDTEQSEYQKAECIISDVTDVLDGTELVAHEVNGSIIFPSIINNFDTSGDQFLQIEFLKKDSDEPATLAEIPEYSLLLDKVGLSYVYGRWHPSSRDQALVPIKTVPTNPIISGGDGDGTGSTPVGGGGGVVQEGGITRCVHELTPILVWSDDGNHFTLPANAIVIGDRLVSWDGEKLAPSKVMRITNGISRMNYRIYANDNELVCSFSHRLIQDMNDFPFGTNVGKMDNRVVVYDKGNVKEVDVDGIESFLAPMKVVTFKMEKGKENYVSSGIFSHNAKSDFEPTLPAV